MADKTIGLGITFDDVLLIPTRSDVVPAELDTSTRFSTHIGLAIPACSAAMDTVTEAELAIALAQEGGIGIIHRNLSIAAQAREVDKVKRAEHGVIRNPITLAPNETVAAAKQVMLQHNVSGLPIVEDGRLLGILTSRDLRFQESLNLPVSAVMTRDRLITAAEGTTLEEAKEMQFRLCGLITKKDIDKQVQFPHACKDERGRLRAGAAVGVHDYQRVEQLIGKDVDVVVVDTAHGHSRRVIETVKCLKRDYDIEVVAGNIVTAEGAKELIDAGADAVKVGIGAGAICTTRVISGAGMPQITAICECAKALEGTDVPLIADGGIRHSGDITKAIAAGAHSVMIGSLFAGLEESPGQMVIYRGRAFKTYRGMGSIGAMVNGSADRYGQEGIKAGGKLVPEGVEGRVPCKGRLSGFVYQLVGGLKAGMGYSGAATIGELRTRGRFIRISASGLKESHPHDVVITQEAPNYHVESEPDQA
jgi:IMP dehydrogenase